MEPGFREMTAVTLPSQALKSLQNLLSLLSAQRPRSAPELGKFGLCWDQSSARVPCEFQHLRSPGALAKLELFPFNTRSSCSFQG